MIRSLKMIARRAATALVSVLPLVSLTAVLTGCALGERCDQSERLRSWMQANGKVKVLCTTAMIEDIAHRVGGDSVDTLTLISGELDPHSYQLVKGDDEKLLFADVVFFNGLELEHGPSLKRHLVGSGNAVSLGDAIHDEHPGLILEVDGQLDPHIWMDIALWARIIDPMVAALSDADPDNAAAYTANGERVHQELSSAHQSVRATMQSVPLERRYLVTSHDAFHYFTRAYLAEDAEVVDGSWQERCAAPEGLAPDSMLSSTDIQGIIDHLSKYRVEVLFSETNVNKDSIRKIVSAGREKGLEIRIADCELYGDAMGCPGSEGDTYVKMIQYNARCIAKQLR